MSYTRPDFDGVLLNFKLILKFEGPSRLDTRGKLPPCPSLSAALSA